MTDFELLWQGGPIFRQAGHFKLGTDSVLLADFARKPGSRRGIDLGCASGIIMLLMLANEPNVSLTGLEIVPKAAELARENMAANGFEDRSRVLCGDIREHRSLFRSGEFDFAVANPPYFPVNSGAVPENAERAAARGELSCDLGDICAAASFLIKTGGSFYMVHRPERLSEVCCRLSANGLEPKRLRFIAPREGTAPSLFLIESKRNAKPSMKIEPNLILQTPDGSETEEIKRIYHRGA